MKNIVKITDMTGFYQLSGNMKEVSEFNTIAYDVQEDILRQLLGDHEYIAFDSDLNSSGVPQTAPYIDFVNGANYSVGDQNYIFSGAKKMLKGYVYNEIVNRWQIKATNSGLRTKEIDNSSYNLTQIKHEGAIRYNRSAKIYNLEAYCWLSENTTDFPKWIYNKSDFYRI